MGRELSELALGFCAGTSDWASDPSASPGVGAGINAQPTTSLTDRALHESRSVRPAQVPTPNAMRRKVMMMGGDGLKLPYPG